jgi:hypothetical protein
VHKSRLCLWWKLIVRKPRDGGGMIGIDAELFDSATRLRRRERFVYEYDFRDSWIHDLRLESTLPFHPRKIYPECIAGKCSAPPEDCGGFHAFMANRQHYARFDRERSDEDLDEIMDEFNEAESDSFSDYDPDRFNRRQINRALVSIIAARDGASSDRTCRGDAPRQAGRGGSGHL